jgi:hypothetical protein
MMSRPPSQSTAAPRDARRRGAALAIRVAGAALLAVAAGAAAPLRAQPADRMIRVDPRTGEMTRCRDDGAGWICGARATAAPPVPRDEIRRLKADNARLLEENARLRRDIAARTLPPDVASEVPRTGSVSAQAVPLPAAPPQAAEPPTVPAREAPDPPLPGAVAPGDGPGKQASAEVSAPPLQVAPPPQDAPPVAAPSDARPAEDGFVGFLARAWRRLLEMAGRAPRDS